MIHYMKIAWNNILHSRRQTAALSLLSLCAMTLMTIGAFLGNGLQGGLTRAVEPFDMLAGYGGSYQMVLNTVFLQDYPARNIPYRIVEEFENDPRVRQAFPLAFGDNYMGYRIVGTDASLFSHYAKNDDPRPWLTCATGKPFSPESRDAVIGARVAADLGLRIGDTITTTHGFVQGGEEHAAEPYVVSGILASCRGPYDQAIFVDLQSVWDAHNNHDDDDDDAHAEQENDAHNDHDDRQTTAIMVKPAGLNEAYQLFTEFSARNDADLVFPAQVVIRLLSILGQADWLLQAIGFAAGGIAALTIALSLYWAASSRKDEALVLRLIGAERRDVLAILAWEGLFTIAPGIAAGRLAGHALLLVIAEVLERKASLHVATGLSGVDFILGISLLLFGLLGEILAGLQMTRKKGK